MTIEKKKILLTGASGFIGSKLKPHLESQGHQIFAPEFDLRKLDEIIKVAEQGPFDVVIHLAGISTVDQARKDTHSAYQINTLGPYLLAKEIQKNSPGFHFIFPSTAHVYDFMGMAKKNEKVIVDENSPILPQNIYADTKYAAEVLLKEMFHMYGMKLTILRLFNHVHKSQSNQSFLGKIYHAFKDSREKNVHLNLGNIEIYRDFSLLHDLLSVISFVMNSKKNSPESKIYNICSGRSYHLKELVYVLAEHMNKNISIDIDASLVRAEDILYIRGNSDRFKNEFHWKPSSAEGSDSFIREFLK